MDHPGRWFPEGFPHHQEQDPRGVSYFRIGEPLPESGYPYLHAGYFREFSDTEKDRLRNHWSGVAQAGDTRHELDFSFKKSLKNRVGYHLP